MRRVSHSPLTSIHTTPTLYPSNKPCSHIALRVRIETNTRVCTQISDLTWLCVWMLWRWRRCVCTCPCRPTRAMQYLHWQARRRCRRLLRMCVGNVQVELSYFPWKNESVARIAAVRATTWVAKNALSICLWSRKRLHGPICACGCQHPISACTYIHFCSSPCAGPIAQLRGRSNRCRRGCCGIQLRKGARVSCS